MNTTCTPSAYTRHLRVLTAYNAFAWRRLFQALHVLPADAYTADAELFAGTIQGTVHHLLLSDYLWYGRHSGQPVVAGVDTKLLGPLWGSSTPRSTWSNPNIPGMVHHTGLVAENCPFGIASEAWADNTRSIISTMYLE